MARYHFLIKHSRRIVPDVEGAQFATLRAAEIEAAESLRDLIVEALRGRASDLPEVIEITDGTGNSLSHVTVEHALPELFQSYRDSNHL